MVKQLSEKVRVLSGDNASMANEILLLKDKLKDALSWDASGNRRSSTNASRSSLSEVCIDQHVAYEACLDC